MIILSLNGWRWTPTNIDKFWRFCVCMSFLGEDPKLWWSKHAEPRLNPWNLLYPIPLYWLIKLINGYPDEMGYPRLTNLTNQQRYSWYVWICLNGYHVWIVRRPHIFDLIVKPLQPPYSWWSNPISNSPIKPHQIRSNPIKSYQIPSNDTPIKSHPRPIKFHYTPIKSHPRPIKSQHSHQILLKPIKSHWTPHDFPIISADFPHLKRWSRPPCIESWPLPCAARGTWLPGGTTSNLRETQTWGSPLQTSARCEKMELFPRKSHMFFQGVINYSGTFWALSGQVLFFHAKLVSSQWIHGNLYAQLTR